MGLRSLRYILGSIWAQADANYTARQENEKMRQTLNYIKNVNQLLTIFTYSQPYKH